MYKTAAWETGIYLIKRQKSYDFGFIHRGGHFVFMQIKYSQNLSAIAHPIESGRARSVKSIFIT